MYADDLLLISASVSQLQNLIDTCTTEFINVGLQINAQKSGFLRVGKRFRVICADIKINGIIVENSQKLRYLGVYLQSGNVLKFNFDYVKRKFYRTANAILSHIGNKAEVILPLVNAQCVPILLYCSEAMWLNKSEKLKLSHPYLMLCSKLFGTFNVAILHECLWYMNSLPLNYLIDLRIFKFLDKLSRSENVKLGILFNLDSHNFVDRLRSDYNIVVGSIESWKTKIWQRFTEITDTCLIAS